MKLGFPNVELSCRSFGAGPVSFDALVEKLRCFKVRVMTPISCILKIFTDQSCNHRDTLDVAEAVPSDPCRSSPDVVSEYLAYFLTSNSQHPALNFNAILLCEFSQR